MSMTHGERVGEPGDAGLHGLRRRWSLRREVNMFPSFREEDAENSANR